mmetsp:Transcript_2182/g.3523  ORF Transcript_2182/g.3523 Transcript_2182/m.3523 type:complete len:294 (-) Transcript_2182:655-1536(-)
MATISDSPHNSTEPQSQQKEATMDNVDKHHVLDHHETVSSESWQRVSQQSTTENSSANSFMDVNHNNDNDNHPQHTESHNDDDNDHDDEQDNVQFDDDYQRVEQEEEEEVEKNLEQALQHKTDGNNYYKLKQFDEALHEYSMAIKYCPVSSDKEKEYMSIFHGNRAACYIALEEWQEAIEECTSSIEYNEKYIKAYWRRAKSYEKLEKYFDAKQDYNQILEIDPEHEISKANLQRIEPLVQQQFEKQKEEVVDKLKGFANWGLGKIGLSLDNFQATQDPQTGAYNINFKQNGK